MKLHQSFTTILVANDQNKIATIRIKTKDIIINAIYRDRYEEKDNKRTIFACTPHQSVDAHKQI